MIGSSEFSSNVEKVYAVALFRWYIYIYIFQFLFSVESFTLLRIDFSRIVGARLC